ncbi:replicative DNA helicase [Glycomyces sp. NPDC021274]|uniref:replicative DNA helicase n=1 Tax=Glycomyces sp. NPDC021274 TaxID=3155120 RepID=UPI0033E72AEF
MTDTDMWADLETQPDKEAAAPRRPTNTDHGAEAAVIGACMLNSDLIDEITLNTDDFENVRHGLIWGALRSLHSDGAPVNPAAVVSALMDTGSLVQAGGGEYVAHLFAEAPAPQSATWHALRVAEMARRRGLDTFAARAAQVTARPVDADTMLDELRRHLNDLDDPDTDDGPVRWDDLVTQGMEAIEAAENPATHRGIPTGLGDLDALIHGLLPGDLDIVAGRPGHGKSTLLAQIAAHAALDRKLPSLLLTLEMRKFEIYNRIVASRLAIPLKALNSGRPGDEGWMKLAKDAGMSADAPLWVDDNTSQTIASIGALARRWKRRHGLRLLLIDYLQLITPPKAENRQNAVSEISRQLKILASQLDIPIIVAAQLNRGPENRPDKRPQASDLRESGSLENDASVIILVHREEVADKNSVRKGEADLIVAKHRHGERGVIPVAAQLHIARFASMAHFDDFGATR